MLVIKRDGRKVTFQPEKIIGAIRKAFKEADGEVNSFAKQVSIEIARYVESLDEDMSVEEIQDIVQRKLMETDRKDIAEKYIIFRNDRSRARERDSIIRKKMREKLNPQNDDRQNANVDGKSFGGRIGAVSSEAMKELALDEYMSEMARKNHLENRIYVHDLDHFAVGDHNCLSMPLDKLLKNGFNVRQTDVRGAQSVGTACQLVAVLFQLQSLQQFGGVSATHLDHTLDPYVRKSFVKHYIVAYLKSTKDFEKMNLIDMLFDTYEDEIGITRNKFEDWVDVHKKECFKAMGLKKKDICMDNAENLNPSFYQSALYDTIIELKQAIEALYHNLNTLQSRSGNQLNWWLAT